MTCSKFDREMNHTRWRNSQKKKRTEDSNSKHADWSNRQAAEVKKILKVLTSENGFISFMLTNLYVPLLL